MKIWRKNVMLSDVEKGSNMIFMILIPVSTLIDIWY